MCGITGMALKARQPLTAELEAMGETQRHRGPDNFSMSIHGHFGFAHNRLSILDLSPAGNQPFEDSRHVLTFNGEIYNYSELKPELIAKGCRFKGSSDTEVLFHSLRLFGVQETLKRIRGMFAFSWFDIETRELALCRDRCGIKPLFWTETPQGLYWSSEAKALAVAAGAKPDLLRTLVAVSGSGDQSNIYTIFKGVFHVPPGGWLELRPGGRPTLRQYYSPIHDVSADYYNELDRMPEAALLDTFDKLFRTSVQRMLMSDVPLGVFASGGLDSSLIAAVANQFQKNITLFTSNVVGQYSEIEYSRMLAKSLGCELHVSEFQPEQMLEDLARVTYHYECPLVKFTNAIPMARVAELARKNGVKPVLTGEGSDELFLGYPGIAYKRYLKLLELPIQAIRGLYGLVPGLRRVVERRSGPGINDFIAGVAMGFERQFIADTGGEEAYSFLPKAAVPDHYKSIQMLTEHLVALLHRNDRVGMQHSIESRFPFLDEDLIRFGVNLPIRWKIRKTLRMHDRKHPFEMDKAIVRRVAERYLPESLNKKPKWGFGIYGFNYMQLGEKYFNGGYIAESLGLSDKVLEYMVRTQDSYSVNKLVGVDVFGRLFDRGESIDAVTEQLKRHCKIKAGRN